MQKHRSLSKTNALLICALCKLQIVLGTLYHLQPPHTQSLFLFPIVFGDKGRVVVEEHHRPPTMIYAHTHTHPQAPAVIRALARLGDCRQVHSIAFTLAISLPQA